MVQETVQRRLFFVLEQSGAGLVDASNTQIQNFKSVSGRVLEEKPVQWSCQHYPASEISHLGLVSLPSSRVGQGGLVGFLDRTLIKAIQRHCAAVRVQAIACATG